MLSADSPDEKDYLMRLQRLTEGVFSVHSITAVQARRLLRSAEHAEVWEQASVISSDARGGSGSRVDEKSRSGSVWLVPHDESAALPLHRALKRTLMPLIQHEWNLQVEDYEAIQVVRYRAGQRYAAHEDVRSPGDGRCFTVLWALNADYTGGATAFPRIGISWNGAPGEALVFPSNYLHAAQAVGRGTKYVAVTWIVRPVTNAWLYG